MVPNQVVRTHVFAEAAVTRDGFIIADFLAGRAEGAFPGGEVEHALLLFRDAFPAFCEKHGIDVSDYHAFLARFIASNSGNSYIITVEDRTGRRSSREYLGSMGKRSKAQDELGRSRPKVFHSPFD